ncbi:MAG: hypothetical protein J3Q66DRAFT_367072 [Benniella sp.]|nr:MAG: hypothetical protein J3Q66DRAFT_367072 [Benniella sp.]
MGRPKTNQSDSAAKGITNDTFGIDEMLEAAASKTASHLYSDATRSMYTGHVARGHEYLQNFNNGEFEEALNDLIEQTPTAVLAFIAFKCEREDKSFKTAEAIRSAFKQFFRNSHHCQDGSRQAEDRLLTPYHSFASPDHRNEELVRLRRKDLELGLTTANRSPYLTITLTFRKTNQAVPSEVRLWGHAQSRTERYSPQYCKGWSRFKPDLDTKDRILREAMLTGMFLKRPGRESNDSVINLGANPGIQSHLA